MSNIPECPICFENCDTNVFLPCKHYYHLNCLKSWLNKNKSCPLCRIYPKHIIQLHPISNQINNKKPLNSNSYSNHVLFNRRNTHRFYTDNIIQRQTIPFMYRTHHISGAIYNRINSRNHSHLYENRFNSRAGQLLERENSRARRLFN